MNNVGQAAALVSLTLTEELAQRVALIVAERERVAGRLRELDYVVTPSQGNFVWLPLPDPSAERLRARLEAANVLTRPQPGGLRITVGTPEENDRLLAALT